MKLRILGTMLIALATLGQMLGQQPARSLPTQQNQSDDDVVRISTNLVQLDAVVTDAKGRPVNDLGPLDFEVFEDGRPQQITNLSYISLSQSAETPATASVVQPKGKTALPVPSGRLSPEDVRRTVALVVDDLGLSFESTAYVRKTLKKFVDEQMQPGDLVAIVRTSAGSGAMQQFTSDKRQLNAAIERVRWYPFGRSRVGSFAPFELDAMVKLKTQTERTLPAIATRSSDLGPDATEEIGQFRQQVFSIGTLGAVRFLVQGMEELPGRKSVLLISDGISIFNLASHELSTGGSSSNSRRTRDRNAQGVMEALRQLTDLANRASVVIYSMDARGLQTLGVTASDNASDLTSQQLESRITDRRVEYFNSQDGLDYLASQTGGFFIRNTNDLSAGVQKVLDDQKGYYLIGYRPEDATFERITGRRKFHHLEVKVKRPGLKVRTRTGFFGVSDEELRAKPRAGDQQLLRSVVAPVSRSEIRLRLTSLFGQEPKTGSVVRALLHIDGRDLSFTDEPDGWHRLAFDILAVTFGDAGVTVDQFGRSETMRVRDEAYRQAQQHGLVYTLNVPIKKAGAYHLRIAVRDVSSDRIGSANEFVEIPDLKKRRLALSGIVITGLPGGLGSTGPAPTPAVAGSDAGSGNRADQSDTPDPEAGPAVRRLRPGMALQYAYLIYNAKLDQTRHPGLKTQVRLFRDGQLIYTAPEISVKAQQTDTQQIPIMGVLQLGSKLEAGEYFLQVIVTDELANQKYQMATHWIDFEIARY